VSFPSFSPSTVTYWVCHHLCTSCRKADQVSHPYMNIVVKFTAFQVRLASRNISSNLTYTVIASMIREPISHWLKSYQSANFTGQNWVNDLLSTHHKTWNLRRLTFILNNLLMWAFQNTNIRITVIDRANISYLKTGILLVTTLSQATLIYSYIS